MRMFSIFLAVCAAGAVAFASTGRAAKPVTQTLNPPAPSYYTCKATGDKTICAGNPPTESYGPIDTADEGPPIVCGSGPSAFHVFDAGTDEVTARRIYDSNGDLVERELTDDYTFGEFSNPLTGASVPYTQSDRRVDDLAVPGDLGSATETTTWHIDFHLEGGGAPLFVNNGRTITAPDGTVVFRAGRLDFFDLFLDGDTSVLDRLCAALAG